MKKLLGSFLFVSVLGLAHAEGEAPQKGQMLEEAKAHTLKMLDMRIQALQESKTCVTNAKSKEDMHKCREAAQKDMKEFKGAREENRKEWKEKREEWKGKREEWKGKRQEWKDKRKELRGGGGAEGNDGPPPAPENE